MGKHHETEITPDEIKQVREAYGERKPKDDKIVAANKAVGTIRPNASDQELTYRSYSQGRSLGYAYRYYFEHGIDPATIQEIEASEKEFMEVLEPEYLLLARIIVREDYKKELTPEKATRFLLNRWGSLILKQGLNKAAFFSEEELEKIRGLLDAIGQTDQDSESKKREFVEAVMVNPIYSSIKKSAETKAAEVDEDTYNDMVAETIYNMIQRARTRDRAPALGNCKLTYGIEDEVYTTSMISGSRSRLYKSRLDSVQELGIPVSYDAIRELPVPYSYNSRDQIRAWLELFKSGIISPQTKLNVHINVGGLQDDLEDCLVLHFIARSANLFNSSRALKQLEGSPIYTPDHAKKHLRPGDADSYETPVGLPILFRKNNENVEFRGLGGVRNFAVMARGLTTFSSLTECAAANWRIKKGLSANYDEDKPLSDCWDSIKQTAFAFWSDRVGWDAKELLEGIREYGEMYYVLERDVPVVDGQIAKMSNEDESFRREFYRLCLLARQVVRKNGKVGQPNKSA
ncbi:hypothetical protein HY419_00325 [candidate division WWE3 bacterium]|nr:hypothetical protein [candidate division WWE3 bacterium]